MSCSPNHKEEALLSLCSSGWICKQIWKQFQADLLGLTLHRIGIFFFFLSKYKESRKKIEKANLHFRLTVQWVFTYAVSSGSISPRGEGPECPEPGRLFQGGPRRSCPATAICQDKGGSPFSAPQWRADLPPQAQPHLYLSLPALPRSMSTPEAAQAQAHTDTHQK